MSIIQIILFSLMPLLFIYLEKKSKLMASLGTVMLCYGFGILIGNIKFLPLDSTISSSMTEFTVPVALPLLLFSIDIRAWFKLAKTTLASFALAILSVSVGVVIASYFFKDLPSVWKMAGMLVGVYTGGTPNMSAIGMALDVKEDIFVLLNAADLLICGVYFFVLTGFGQKILQTFLPPFKKAHHDEILTEDEKPISISRKEAFSHSLLSLPLSLSILGAAAGLSYLFFGKIAIPFVILCLTSFALLCSLSDKVRSLKFSYDLGQYFLFIFCISIGSLADISKILSVGSDILLFTSAVVILSILIHFILCYFSKIDADTALITHVAAIYGPAFIGPVVDSMKNRQMLLSGISTGLMGYALGNYVGLGIAYLIKFLFSL